MTKAEIEQVREHTKALLKLVRKIERVEEFLNAIDDGISIEVSVSIPHNEYTVDRIGLVVNNDDMRDKIRQWVLSLQGDLEREFRDLPLAGAKK